MTTNPDALRAAACLFGIDFPLRVLVVEDNIDLARMLTLLLQGCGFEVKTLHDGHLALATARSFRPHFILLDIGLPGMNGFEVAESIRGDPSFSKVIIISVSAYGPEMYSDRRKRSGIDHHLTKPVEFDELLTFLIPQSIHEYL